MSSFIKPSKGVKPKSAFQIRPRGAGSSIARDRIEAQRASSMDPVSVPQPGPSYGATSATPKKGNSCPNPRCPNPSAPVTDGFCSACGREIDSSNIVAEVQFGETSSGAAMVQGSYLAADQGASRPMGPGMRRLGGMVGDNREKTIREARNMMWGFRSRLRNISEGTIEAAIMIFKLALSENWLQGRGMDKVVPVCLYTACRREDRCDVMLIDFAELVHINVYELGHVFKDLNTIYSFQSNNVRSIIPEDLIMRFAEKLDFGDFTNKVAADATRLCQRMGRDWMVIGRRPSGICGACLLMSARMWNFRRTIRQIVYVVKVTVSTIQERLDEFSVTESSDLSIEDFLHQEFLESRHDPPAFYKQTAEWQAKKAKGAGKKRKRPVVDVGDDLHDEMVDGVSQISTDMPPPPIPRPAPDTSKYRQVNEFLPRSFDSDANQDIVVQFDHTVLPKPAPKVSHAEKAVMDGLRDADPNSESALEELVQEHGDDAAEAGEEEEMEETGKKRKGKRRRQNEPEGQLLLFNEEWERDEKELEKQITEVINDPHSDAHRKALATAAKLAVIKAEWARAALPNRNLSMNAIITEDEFADDPEVQFCVLTAEEAKCKEDIWMNANQDWLRKQQEKEYRKQLEALGPPKRRRNRVKRPRIGEGQASPAESAEEAMHQAANRLVPGTKRINYDALTSYFTKKKSPAGPGSAASRLASRAGSEVPRDSVTPDVPATPAPAPVPAAKVSQTPAEKAAPEQPAEEEEEEEVEEEIYEEEETFDDGPGYDEEDWDNGDEEEEEYY
ncbi:hypothetical protein F4780DRAFT_751000 [Xylariomycetidae sp. FL0641]|nr:hypothetical protein F4780DRAFT_751000 [Xylariomycetidae sp. FL0641]